MNDHQQTPHTIDRRDFLRSALITATAAAATAAAVSGASVADAAAQRRVIGGLVSTTLGKHLVYEGIGSASAPDTMNSASAYVPGVVHELGTAQGDRGVTVVAGHRTSMRRPFRYLDQLPIGEQVRYDNYADDTQTVYEVVEIKYPLDPKRVYDEVCGQTVRYGSDTRLNLYACTRANGRPTSTKYRIVVFCVAVA
jgi:hypothetical protein